MVEVIAEREEPGIFKWFVAGLAIQALWYQALGMPEQAARYHGLAQLVYEQSPEVFESLLTDSDPNY